jgi:uncharacterized protein YaaQ
MPAPDPINQLVVVTLAREQLDELIQHLTQDGFQATQVDRGSLLQEIPVSLLIGLNRVRLPRLLKHVRECCHVRRRFIPAQAETPWQSLGMMIEAEVGGAVVYALDVDRFEQL